MNGAAISAQLVAWAKQHVEWTLSDGAALYPDGVLMTVVDEAGSAAMAVGPYEPLARTTVLALARRAARSAQEGERTGVSPETLWALSDGRLLWGAVRDEAAAGTASLVCDLARTLGFVVERDEGLAERALAGEPRSPPRCFSPQTSTAWCSPPTRRGRARSALPPATRSCSPRGASEPLRPGARRAAPCCALPTVPARCLVLRLLTGRADYGKNDAVLGCGQDRARESPAG